MNKRKEVESLIDKAEKAHDAGDALKWSQAACNAANAMCALKIAEGGNTHPNPTEGKTQ